MYGIISTLALMIDEYYKWMSDMMIKILLHVLSFITRVFRYYKQIYSYLKNSISEAVALNKVHIRYEINFHLSYANKDLELCKTTKWKNKMSISCAKGN